MTSVKGIGAIFNECFVLATETKPNDVKVPVLHINYFIANKKVVGRPKDRLGVINLEKILRLCEEEN